MIRLSKFFPVLAVLVLVTSLAPVATLGGSENPAPAQADTVIFPRGSGPAVARFDEPKGPSSSSAVLAVSFLLALGGVWLWLKRRHPAGWAPGKTTARLNIAETRSLGNRQFLIVASYEDKKYLLGVCPGQVTLLTSLDSSEDFEA